jgi:hypothetical protein
VVIGVDGQHQTVGQRERFHVDWPSAQEEFDTVGPWSANYK